METLQFKTNIKCAGCIATVTPVLNELLGPDNWTVDVSVPDKILTIPAPQVSETDIKEAIANAGYQATILP